MTKANDALWLQASLKSEAEQVARAEGTTLNQFINVMRAHKPNEPETAGNRPSHAETESTGHPCA